MTARPLASAPPTSPPAVEARPAGLPRLLPLDVMRGLVMMLMAIDHSSEAFNAGRLFTDSALFYRPGTPLPAAQFLTRWVTHLCAPTFLFLAGTGLAFTVQKERARHRRPLDIDRYLLVRGILIAAFELWISLFLGPPRTIVLQVLYAIGTSYVLMIPLRRVPWRAAAAGAALFVLIGEVLVGVAAGSDPSPIPLVFVLLLVGGLRPSLIVVYPMLHWLALMLLGWAWGHRLIERPAPDRILARRLAVASFGLIACFAVVRGANSYGNMALLRDGNSLVDWLHVSKYPPSLTYVTLELGVMCACLSALFALSGRVTPSPNHPLVVLGQTPMFFYLLHFPLLVESAHLLGVSHRLGLGATYLGALAVVAILYPACRAYRTYKSAHKNGWPRFI
jgi:uncharacterized membrane protein